MENFDDLHKEFRKKYPEHSDDKIEKAITNVVKRDDIYRLVDRELQNFEKTPEFFESPVIALRSPEKETVYTAVKVERQQVLYTTDKLSRKLWGHHETILNKDEADAYAEKVIIFEKAAQEIKGALIFLESDLKHTEEGGDTSIRKMKRLLELSGGYDND